jgi:hypothetical protein
MINPTLEASSPPPAFPRQKRMSEEPWRLNEEDSAANGLVVVRKETLEKLRTVMQTSLDVRAFQGGGLPAPLVDAINALLSTVTELGA